MNERRIIKQAAFVSAVVILSGVFVEADHDVQQTAPTSDHHDRISTAIPKDELAEFTRLTVQTKPV